MKSLVCRGDAAVLARGEIIGLADVVEHVELDHEMMDAVLSGLQHREAVMARIDVEEIDLERLEHVVAQPQPEHVLIEPQHVLDALDREHDVAHAERPGAEPGDGAARPERLDRDLGAVKRFEPVAQRVDERDELLYAARVGERLRLALDAYARGLEPGRELVERGGIRDLPAEKGGPVGIVGLDDEPLAAVVHAQAQRGPAALDELHAEKVFAETRPILEVAGAQPDIAERLQCHVRLLIAGSVRVPRLLYRIRPVPLRAFHGPAGERPSAALPQVGQISFYRCGLGPRVRRPDRCPLAAVAGSRSHQDRPVGVRVLRQPNGARRIRRGARPA